MKELKLYEVPAINSIQEMLILSAKTYADKIALEDLSETQIQKVTYNQLFENVVRFGKALSKRGLKERDHIAVIGENRVQWGITYLTAMCFNYVIVPIDKNLSHNEILNVLHESDSVAIVFSETYESMLKEKG
ncbi:MAG: AMP-binding protein, partial [Ignavibacteriaceae bacterium]|nr:AMP-binding protein [Ignavibacteriaceae bacterium]